MTDNCLELGKKVSTLREDIVVLSDNFTVGTVLKTVVGDGGIYNSFDKTLANVLPKMNEYTELRRRQVIEC